MASTLLGGGDPTRPRYDLDFSEAINQSMQVPARLKVAGGPGLEDPQETAGDLPPSFHMHIPDRISVAEATEGSLRPLFRQNSGSTFTSVPVDVSGGLTTLVRAGTTVSRSVVPLGPAGRLQRERAPGEDSRLSLQRAKIGHDRPKRGSSPAPVCPPFMQGNRIFCLQNVFQAVWFLGSLLSHRLQASLMPQAQPSSQDLGPALEASLEDMGGSEIMAMKKQLYKISRRLQSLEEQCSGWRQKELLLYSMLVSACVVNTWLWMRR
ncbi:mitochondrial fission factor homolog A-like [Tachyglossus aculeatus]|uniref:mitochondrial fission factor homolog A-like n=1 Tax=Tachyglossus aculeatus TaxID=9261 RepID=UPI0018F64026|nr:mitochondrial fission factor homolog A-like [Tachyglossus aculeatus]